MRHVLLVAFLSLLPLAAGAQRWNAPATRMAPMRPAMAMRAGPMARPVMVRPGPVPVRGGFAFNPGVRPGMRVNPQWHHGSRHGHIGFRFGPGFGRFPFGVPPQNRCFSDAFFDPFFCTRTPTRFSSFVPFGSFLPFASYPYYSAPYLYDDTSYNSSNADNEQVERANARASDLAAQVQQLRDELQELREQQGSEPAKPAPAAVPAQPAREDAPVATTLVFRDGRRSEVENYAIVGNTLWVFNDQLRKKIPIAELDLKATQAVNEDKGVEFTVPAPGK